MTERIPLGEKESLHQEFKSREALKKPETIAREVVAMLNAKGGTVWVGLRDEGDRAVAVEPVPDADRERRRLRDYLVDTIEPSPTGGEVAVDVVPAEGGGEILRVDVHPQKERAPYAHLREGGRFFLVRVDDRTRPMAREEISKIFSRGANLQEGGVQQAEKKLLEDREKLLKSGERVLWLGIQPASNLGLDLQETRLEEVLRDASLSGNRRAGYHFAWSDCRPELKADRLVSKRGDGAFVEIWLHGGLRFQVRLDAMYWPERGEIWPPALLEYPIAAFRMAGAIFRDKLRSEDVVLGDLALVGAKGTSLRAGSRCMNFYGITPTFFDDADDLVWEQPLRFSSKEVIEASDLCGARLVERVYQAFDWRRESMPPEFDWKTGRLVLPE
jgi:hypothetical protein